LDEICDEAVVGAQRMMKCAVAAEVPFAWVAEAYCVWRQLQLARMAKAAGFALRTVRCNQYVWKNLLLKLELCV